MNTEEEIETYGHAAANDMDGRMWSEHLPRDTSDGTRGHGQ